MRLLSFRTTVPSDVDVPPRNKDITIRERIMFKAVLPAALLVHYSFSFHTPGETKHQRTPGTETLTTSSGSDEGGNFGGLAYF